MTRGMFGMLSIVVASVLVLGGVTPPPAQADDTGRIIAGIAVGALVYGLLDDEDQHRPTKYWDGGRGDRGFYNGNSGRWSERPRRSYRTPRHRNYDPPRYRSARRYYERGYDDGWRDGYGVGFGDGHDVGYSRGWDRGYDYGYDRGYDRGYDDGARDWGCWGGWGY